MRLLEEVLGDRAVEKIEKQLNLWLHAIKADFFKKKVVDSTVVKPKTKTIYSHIF